MGTLLFVGALFVESYELVGDGDRLRTRRRGARLRARESPLPALGGRPSRGYCSDLALAASVTVTLLGAVRPNAWVSLVLFAALSFIAGGRTLAGSARGLGPRARASTRRDRRSHRCPPVRLVRRSCGIGGLGARRSGGFEAARAHLRRALRVRDDPARALGPGCRPVDTPTAPRERLRGAHPRARGEPVAARRAFVRDARPRRARRTPSPVRTPFQRDRDRIVHSKPFRRLKGKTQVFIDPEGDHYRTRMTHTLETSAISRVVARALRLNEDLVEAIGLGHDMGHTPFGHAGEETLDEALYEHVRSALPAQRALARHRPAAQPHARGLRRHPHAYGRPGAGDARGQDRAHRRSRRVHQPRHRRRRPLRPVGRSRSAGRRDRAARADRVEAHRPARARPRGHVRRGGRHRPEPGGGGGDALAAVVHVRARLPRAAGRGTSTGAHTTSCGGSSTT